MQSTENLQNTTSSNMKEHVTISEADQQSSRSRGEVAAREQIRILNQVTANKTVAARRTKEGWETVQLIKKAVVVILPPNAGIYDDAMYNTGIVSFVVVFL
jgi:hypothetical protein